MNNTDLAVAFRTLAYRDYIAARLLLNKKYAFQGLTLASSSIEKYIKIILIASGVPANKVKGHLDDLEKFQKLLSEHYTDFTIKFDKRFLDLLSKGYKARYYDNLKEPIMIGFFIGQLLCELDYAVNIIEQLITINDTSGAIIKSPYRRAVDKREIDLIENNFIFINVPKKEFMERPDQGFGAYIDPKNGFNELEIEAKDVINPYDGVMWEINVILK